ncbi:transposase [Ralstonia solanacearum]|uniref:transposase n=1 Tax=Ralstonia solanacearum TaxID=305 RepID=UPI001FF92E11|nr:transposase [Ralstonia solanacearum]MDB0529488.1 transposase [Ralstonia solanacearum]
MTQTQDLRDRLVAGRKRDGRREFHEAAVQELVELCLKPGVSIARMAMNHDVNPNQLRRWIARHQQSQIPCKQDDLDPMVIDDVADAIRRPMPAGAGNVDATAAFVQVVQPSAVAAVSPLPPPSRLMSLSLHVRLANGVELNLGEANLEELTTLVQMLGRLPCSGSTTA